MSEHIALEIIKEIGSIITSLVWPALILFIVFSFKFPIGTFFGKIDQLIFKGPGGVEISAKFQEIVANIGAAEASKRAAQPEGVNAPSPQNIPIPTDVLRHTLVQLASPTVAERIRGARVLWVDDKPTSNFYETESLKSLGVAVDSAASTEDAEDLLRRREYDLIITDLKRGPDPDAGLNFLKDVLSRDPKQRIVVYSNFRSLERKNAVLHSGARGMTNSPSELFELVINNLRGER